MDFETFPIQVMPSWRANEEIYAGPFSEVGEYFVDEGIVPPDSNRTTVPLGSDGWLVAEIYTRHASPILVDYIDVVPDPSDAANTVLRLASPDHTDGVILRTRDPLPVSYELSYRIGYMSFGGDGPANGYDGGEQSGPWDTPDATDHNGFYWLAVMDTLPVPHNNRWSHHHRKFFIDTWNNRRDEFGINIAGIDGTATSDPRFGRDFIAYDGKHWRTGEGIRPVDHYFSEEWYEVRLRKTETGYQFSISGRFRNQGHGTLSGELDALKTCPFHFRFGPSVSAPAREECAEGPRARVGNKLFDPWPAGPEYPDFFMIGDPHINYYEGSLLVDDFVLKALE